MYVITRDRHLESWLNPSLYMICYSDILPYMLYILISLPESLAVALYITSQQ